MLLAPRQHAKDAEHECLRVLAIPCDLPQIGYLLMLKAAEIKPEHAHDGGCQVLEILGQLVLAP